MLDVSGYFKQHSMKLKQRPYNLLFLNAIILSIGGLFCFNSPIDIHLYDTYFVFPLPFLIWAPTIILFVFWIVYLLTKRFLFSKKLMWIHIILTVIISLFLMVLPYISTYSYGGVVGSPRRYYDYGELNRFKILGNLTNIAVATFVILLLGQLAYFINLFVGLYKRIGRQNNR
jgi:heme/copper-type cytochrome/quinol oxidase subunit 1